jgi:hypothetical protein
MRSNRSSPIPMPPFVFATGYDALVIPPRFEKITHCEKRVDMTKVVEAIGRIVEA